ncbi:hypothetical protein ACWJJH_04155 [Endozoicomonadaceae bacterium StTr2]
MRKPAVITLLAVLTGCVGNAPQKQANLNVKEPMLYGSWDCRITEYTDFGKMEFDHTMVIRDDHTYTASGILNLKFRGTSERLSYKAMMDAEWSLQGNRIYDKTKSIEVLARNSLSAPYTADLQRAVDDSELLDGMAEIIALDDRKMTLETKRSPAIRCERISS